MTCVKLIYILLYNSFTGHLYLYAPLLYIIYLLMTKSLTFTLLLLNVLLFLFSILKYFLIICLNLHFARVASLLTQCLTSNVLHMLLHSWISTFNRSPDDDTGYSHTGRLQRTPLFLARNVYRYQRKELGRLNLQLRLRHPKLGHPN